MAAIEYEILGGLLVRDRIVSYSVSEEITSLDPSEFSGSVGSISVDTVGESLDQNFRLALGQDSILSDPERGSFHSVVRAVQGTDDSATFTGDSVLSKLNVWRTVPPLNTDLQTALETIMGDIGVTIEVDPSINTNVIVHGTFGNVWDEVKKLLSAVGAELSLVKDVVVVRPPLLIQAYDERRTTESYNFNTDTISETVQIYYYPTEASLTGSVPNYLELFPTKSDPTPSPIVVNAGETIVQRIQLDGSILALSQPTIASSVPNESRDGQSSIYSVAGNDGLPITPAQWTAAGGKLTVAADENDPTVLVVTVVGANLPQFSPMRIAMTAGTSSFYNSLHVTGLGTRWSQELLTLRTGAPTGIVSPDTVITVDNNNIQSLSQAYSAGLYTARRYAGPTVTISGSAWSLSDPSTATENGVVFTTFDNWLTEDDIDTFDEFDTAHDGETFADIDVALSALVTDTFAAQLFGNAIGAKLVRPDNIYRIVSTTTSETSVEYNAESTTTFNDFDTSWGEITFNDWDDNFESDGSSSFQHLALNNFKRAED